MGKLRFLLDENVGSIVAKFLQGREYDVASIIEHTPGMRDREVLQKAVKEDRILITLDKDIGTLIYHYSQKHVGVIFLRLKKESPQNISNLLSFVLDAYADKIDKKFVTITEKKIRIR